MLNTIFIEAKLLSVSKIVVLRDRTHGFNLDYNKTFSGIHLQEIEDYCNTEESLRVLLSVLAETESFLSSLKLRGFGVLIHRIFINFVESEEAKYLTVGQMVHANSIASYLLHYLLSFDSNLSVDEILFHLPELNTLLANIYIDRYGAKVR